MLKLRDIMTTDVVTVTPETTLRDTMELLARRHVSGAPVVSGERVVGVVSASDLLTFAGSEPGVPAERAPEPLADEEWSSADLEEDEVPVEDEPTGMYFTEMWEDAGAEVTERVEHSDSPEWNELEQHTVSEVMTRRVIALAPDALVQAAAEVMREEGIHRVLVMQGRVLRGIVTAMDITKAVADNRIEKRTYVFNRDEEFRNDLG